MFPMSPICRGGSEELYSKFFVVEMKTAHMHTFISHMCEYDTAAYSNNKRAVITVKNSFATNNKSFNT